MGDGAIGSQLVLITVSMNLTERLNRFVTVITRCQNMEETCVQNLISTKDSFHVMQQITKVWYCFNFHIPNIYNISKSKILLLMNNSKNSF